MAAQPNLGPMRSRQPLEHPLLVRRILVELIDVGALQAVHAEMRHRFAQVAFRGPQHLLHRFVHVDDFVAGIRDHHVGGDAIQSRHHPLHALGLLRVLVFVPDQAFLQLARRFDHGPTSPAPARWNCTSASPRAMRLNP
jgi:hypothetical protein